MRAKLEVGGYKNSVQASGFRILQFRVLAAREPRCKRGSASPDEWFSCWMEGLFPACNLISGSFIEFLYQIKRSVLYYLEGMPVAYVPFCSHAIVEGLEKLKARRPA